MLTNKGLLHKALMPSLTKIYRSSNRNILHWHIARGSRFISMHQPNAWQKYTGQATIMFFTDIALVDHDLYRCINQKGMSEHSKIREITVDLEHSWKLENMHNSVWNVVSYMFDDNALKLQHFKAGWSNFLKTDARCYSFWGVCQTPLKAANTSKATASILTAETVAEKLYQTTCQYSKPPIGSKKCHSIQ